MMTDSNLTRIRGATIVTLISITDSLPFWLGRLFIFLKVIVCAVGRESLRISVIECR